MNQKKQIAEFIENLKELIINNSTIEASEEDAMLHDVVSVRATIDEFASGGMLKVETTDGDIFLDIWKVPYSVYSDADEQTNDMNADSEIDVFGGMELGNLLFGHSRGIYHITDRDVFEHIFQKLLARGFDRYGVLCDEKLERQYCRTKTSQYTNAKIYSSATDNPDYHPHLHCFDNGVFMINPYYWGDAEDLMELPNFVYYPEDIEIRWYKYPFRDAYTNKELSSEKFKEIIDNCLKSLDSE